MTKQYCVAFSLHEVRDVKSFMGNPTSLVVAVRCCGQEYKSQVKRDKIHSATWKEHHAWPELKVHPIQFASAFIEFELQECCTFYRNSVIGACVFQLEWIRRICANSRNYIHNLWSPLRHVCSPDIV
ncbi:hypothetical protein IE077_002805, partial [Cardiosporidium cionae]